jgi:hypothetical protein
MATAKEIFLAEKEIGHFPGWSGPEEETGYLWFDAPIEIGGVTETGLVLHGGCLAARPECHVSFELRIARAPGRRLMPIERIDWRSLEGGHSNRRKPSSEWAGQRVSDTHLHDFWLNWSEQEKRLRSGNLRVAREIDEPLEDFTSVLAFVGKRLRINNIQVVKFPPWEYDFFSLGGLR